VGGEGHGSALNYTASDVDEDNHTARDGRFIIAVSRSRKSMHRGNANPEAAGKRNDTNEGWREGGKREKEREEKSMSMIWSFCMSGTCGSVLLALLVQKCCSNIMTTG